MGNSNNNSFRWQYTEEPHKSRRIEILKKYPEIKKLMKTTGDRRVAVLGCFILLIHLSIAFIIYPNIPYIPLRFALASAVGSFLSTALLMHCHEAGHGLIFGPNHIWKNRIYGVVVNLGVSMPFFALFKKFHKKHHKHTGDANQDFDYPTDFEKTYFPSTPLGKYAWFVCQPILFDIRIHGNLMRPKFQWYLDIEDLMDCGALFLFYVFSTYFNCDKSLNYLHLSLLVASSFNVFGIWGVTSHINYFDKKETLSYYGWMNKLFLNFGYHMEHHDFPSIPSNNLPLVKTIAPEYYEEEFSLDSFYSAVIKYIFDPKLGINSRIKRKRDV